MTTTKEQETVARVAGVLLGGRWITEPAQLDYNCHHCTAIITEQSMVTFDIAGSGPAFWYHPECAPFMVPPTDPHKNRLGL